MLTAMRGDGRHGEADHERIARALSPSTASPRRARPRDGQCGRVAGVYVRRDGVQGAENLISRLGAVGRGLFEQPHNECAECRRHRVTSALDRLWCFGGVRGDELLRGTTVERRPPGECLVRDDA